MDLAQLWAYLQPSFAVIGFPATGFYFFHPTLFPHRKDITGSKLPETKEYLSVVSTTFDDDELRKKANAIFGYDTGAWKSLHIQEYTIGIITALDREFRAALAVLDERHSKLVNFRKPATGTSQYYCGATAKHNVVIVSFPAGRMGLAPAADVARLLVTAFPSVRVGLLVGIGGAISHPETEHGDIRLGDVVVIIPGSSTGGGVVQYDFGNEQGVFPIRGHMHSPPPALLTAVKTFQTFSRESDMIDSIRNAQGLIHLNNCWI